MFSWSISDFYGFFFFLTLDGVTSLFQNSPNKYAFFHFGSVEYWRGLAYANRKNERIGRKRVFILVYLNVRIKSREF